MQIFDEDSAREAKADDTPVRNWEQEQHNKILSPNFPSRRKQSAWSYVFPKPTYSVEIENMVW